MTTAIEQTVETYGIENWGAGYFDVNRKGNLIVHPAENDSRAADLKEIIDDLRRRGITTPVLLRFPQLLAGQVRKLQRAFSKSIREFEYQGAHMCVYPMKVNQQRAVVEEYLREAHAKGFRSVRLIHGKGVGVQREAVRAVLARTPFVESFTDAPPEAGGWGATVAVLARVDGDAH